MKSKVLLVCLHFDASVPCSIYQSGYLVKVDQTLLTVSLELFEVFHRYEFNRQDLNLNDADRLRLRQKEVQVCKVPPE